MGEFTIVPHMHSNVESGGRNSCSGEFLADSILHRWPHRLMWNRRQGGVLGGPRARTSRAARRFLR